MCGDFSENSNINSLLRGGSATWDICARTGTPPRRRHASVARGNRLFTMARDCISTWRTIASAKTRRNQL
jgi:hypothetical protein